MIKVGVGLGIGKEEMIDRAIEYAKYGIGLQLSFFQPDKWDRFFWPALKRFWEEGLEDKLYAIHLPSRAPSLTDEDNKYKHKLAHDISHLDSDVKLVVHPNVKIYDFMISMIYEMGVRQTICIENFQFRKKKEMRSPLEIIEFCVENPKARMCFDTSHAEELWFEYPSMYHLLRFTDVIHLSNRIGRSQHMPFNTAKGDMNLVGFVNDLIPRYKWDGILILEYMKEWNSKLAKNVWYIQRLLGEKKNA